MRSPTLLASATLVLLSSVMTLGVSHAQPPTGALTLARFPARLPAGDAIRTVRVFLDDALVKECAVEDADPSRCFVDQPVAAGVHQLVLVVQCRDATTGATSSCRQVFPDRVVVRPGESLSVDVTGSLAATRGTSASRPAYITSSGGPRDAPSSCDEALAHVAASSSCDARTVEATLAMLEVAARLCSARDMAEARATAIMAHAARSHAYVSPQSCLSADTVRRAPAILLGSPPDGAWPRGTITGSSWRWARASARSLAENPASPVTLASLARALTEARARVTVVAQLLAAYETDADAAQLRRLITMSPWSLDVGTPEGHRNYVNLYIENWDEPYARWLSANVVRDARVHCDLGHLTRMIMMLLVRDRSLERYEWEAGLAMIQHTASDRHIYGCDYVARGDLGEAVPRAERVRTFARIDCDTRRLAALRGDALTRLLRGNDDAALLGAVKNEYATCLER